MFLRLGLVLLLLGFGATATAQTPKVEKILVKGLFRADQASILRAIKTRPGQDYSRSRISNDIKRIFALQLFDDVKVYGKKSKTGGLLLLFMVKEKATIRKVVFEGHKELDLDDIKKVVDLRVNSTLGIPMVKKNQKKIKELYVDEGYFLAEVSYKIVSAPKNQVDVVFQIVENAKVVVKSITFLGNRKISSKQLKANMLTREGSYFAFLTRAGTFKEDIFNRDVAQLNGTYYDHGYLAVKIAPPVISLTRDRRYMYISTYIEEGEQYRIDSIDIKGDFLFPKEKLRKLLPLKSGDIFSRIKLQLWMQKVGFMYKDKGYAYTNVIPQYALDPKTRRVKMAIYLQKGSLVRIGRIVFRGNTRTMDKVMRLRVKLHEGDLYSETLLQKSKQEIIRLGFFKKVTYTQQQGARKNLMDIVFEVTERPTGAFQVGAGFSSVENFIANAQISQNNLFGRGQYLALQAQISSLRTIIQISFVEPYFLDSMFSFSIDLYKQDLDIDDFERSATGGGIGFGYRFTDDFSIALNYKLEYVSAKLLGNTGPVANLFKKGFTSSLTFSVTYDTRDNRLFPNKGHYHSVSVEVAERFLGSQNVFTRFTGRFRYYYPLPWGLVWKNNLTLGYIHSRDAQGVPFFERYFVGGIFTVRGFQRNTLGPSLSTGLNREPGSTLREFNKGGNKQLIFNSEIEFPIFAALNIKGVVFFDAGNAYDDSQPLNPINVRTSVGFGIRWWSPIGPLRFEWGFPLRPKKGEDPVVFEFTIGNQF